MKSVIIIFISCMTCLMFLDVQGQEPTLRVELCSDTILLGHDFTLTYIVEGGQINDLQSPNLESFNILGGPNTSTSMSFINGQMSAKSSVNFILQGIQIGEFTIAPTKILINETEFESEALKIVVLENPDGITPEDLMPKVPTTQKSKKRKTFKL